ncbi:hypothetical protein [Cysteiniphilum litorale]|nr:hypothetical protein [Cysteiniphilum litorale]
MAGHFIFFKKHLLRLSKIKNTAGAAVVDSSGLTSLKYNISVNAPFLTSRWDDTEEDYPRGEEGWSGTVESICFFNDSYYQDIPTNILHDPTIKEKINQYFANLKKH